MRKKAKDNRILGENVTIDNDIRGINGNDLIAGTPGTGKTRGYVIPNLFSGECSKIVADTKGNLYRRYGSALRARGYRVENIDFVNPERSTIGYNPFRFIRRKKNTEFRDSDIRRIAEAICPLETSEEPIWSQQGQMYLTFAISYVMEMNADRYRNFTAVEEVVDRIGTDDLKNDVFALKCERPGCLAERIYTKITTNMPAEKMHASIMGFVNNALNQVADNEISDLYSMDRLLSFEDLGKHKTVLFLTISDTDRIRETLVNLFYSQALQELVRIADEKETSRLDIPVRIIFDDFASNTVIPDFDKIISVVRSRGISVSLILQSIKQLDSMYGESKAMTILDNCDTQIYLGGVNNETAKYFGVKMDKLVKNILSLPLEKECLFIRGQQPRIVDKYDLALHEHELLEIKDKDGTGASTDAEDGFTC